MVLNDVKKFCGVPVNEFHKFAKRYRWLLVALYVFDMVVIFGLTAYMFFHDAKAQTYGVALVFVCVLANFVFSFKIGTSKYEVYKFYRRHKDKSVSQVRYNVTWSDLREVCERAGMKVGEDDHVEDMQKSICVACVNNVKLLGKIMTLLHKYERDSGDLICSVIELKGKKFFIDFVEEDNDGNHHPGTVEESDSESAD